VKEGARAEDIEVRGIGMGRIDELRAGAGFPGEFSSERTELAFGELAEEAAEPDAREQLLVPGEGREERRSGEDEPDRGLRDPGREIQGNEKKPAEEDEDLEADESPVADLELRELPVQVGDPVLIGGSGIRG
jgi:hypothetical protein